MGLKRLSLYQIFLCKDQVSDFIRPRAPQNTIRLRANDSLRENEGEMTNK